MKKSDKYFEADDKELGYFSNLLPKDQQWFSPKEIGAIIGRSDQYVRNTFYSGKIFGHLSNGGVRKGDEKKTYLRVHRNAIALYLAQSANYSTDDIVETVVQIIGRLSDYNIMRVSNAIKDILNGVQPKIWNRQQR